VRNLIDRLGETTSEGIGIINDDGQRRRAKLVSHSEGDSESSDRSGRGGSSSRV